ncbi:hypothetical protein ACQ9AR_07115 [Streptomyces lividans]|uniref:Uncharacterized protein n=2 Tax=Streptomyces lividans TaxID=1916 RepID=A0A7U9HER5_STRLI|nr:MULTISPECIES: hypothetical protein [Streptomyces]QSJ08156.1 hypothetical protein SLIVDG2_08150 [Streptomyces lividans]AIJ12644.1 hypothetical protein SLIV_08150 [Streptomyces lividans TK24]EFD65992.1 predicted protein [Streptomyces lividans TK24]EOY51093.1 hypothetical protein SLI_6386 [Streptomyces lividans 1326]KKD17186.1 hypothetical protein TR66_02125 [Streptomyces sp. WM6391]
MASHGARGKPGNPETFPAAGRIASITENEQFGGTMALRATMKVKYKETARGGLAVNIIDC